MACILYTYILYTLSANVVHMCIVLPIVKIPYNTTCDCKVIVYVQKKEKVSLYLDPWRLVSEV